jgi:hypothetical protein
MAEMVQVHERYPPCIGLNNLQSSFDPGRGLVEPADRGLGRRGGRAQ